MRKLTRMGGMIAVVAFSVAAESQAQSQDQETGDYFSRLGKGVELTLQEAVERVVAYHPGLISALGYQESAQEMIDVAKSNYYPKVSGGVSSGYNRYRSGRYEDKYLQNLDLNFQQLIYDFGKTDNTVKKAEFGDLKAEARTNLVLDQLIRETANAALEAVRFKGLTGLAEEQVQQVSQLTSLVEQRYEEGASNLSDVLQARSRLDAVEALVFDVEMQYQKWLQELALLVQLPDITDVSLMGFPDAFAQSCVIQNIEWHRVPEVVMTDMAAEEASADMALASAEEWPTISFQGGVSRAINATPNYGGRVETSVQLNLSMPFYQGGGLSANKRAASGALRAATAEKAQIRLQVQQRIADQVSRYQALLRRKDLLANRVKNITGTKDLYKKQYVDLGTRSLVDLLNAEQEYHQARVDVLNGELDLKVSQIECAYLQGFLGSGFDVVALK